MPAIHDATPAMNPELEHLRRDRERFVAFAFCCADILLELDRSQKVTYASGAIEELTGYQESDLMGRNLLDLVVPDERVVLHEILRGVADGQRLQPKTVHLSGVDGPTPALAMTGYCLPDLDGHYYLALRMGPAIPSIEAPGQTRRDRASGLLDAESFQTVAGAQLKQSGRNAGYRLTFLELGGFAALRERLDAQTREEVIKTIGAHLRARSLFGDTAARIDDDRFGLLHGQDVDPDEIESRISEITREADPTGSGVVVRAAGIDLDIQGMSETDAVRALAYTIGKYAEERDQPLSVQTLSDSLKIMVEETGRQMGELKAKARTGAFDIAFQPIVELATRELLHLEALARLDSTGSPARIIRFAEDVSVVAEFDLAMCRKVADGLASETGPNAGPAVAVNISNRSAADPAFGRALHRLLDERPGLADRLIFEITESASIADLPGANEFIQSLRTKGHKVCLDDFGSCTSALQYLQELQVDMVKIDGRHLEDALATRSGAALLRALARLCDELDVLPIAYRVENEAIAAKLEECGIRYAQGYLFGPPSDATAPPNGRTPEPPKAKSWKTPRVGALALKSQSRS